MKDNKFSCFLPFLACLPMQGAEVKMRELWREEGGDVRSLFALLSSATDIRDSNIA